MFRARHAPLVLRAIARWAYRSRAGRKLTAAVAVGAVAVYALRSPSRPEVEERASSEGTWDGLRGMIAPTSGPFTIEGRPGGAAVCTVRGLTHSAGAGQQWAFRGDAWVKEASCTGQIHKDGRVSLRLALRNEYHGKVKAIGSDWDEVHGVVDCDGDLVGELSGSGTWNATCRSERSTWTTSFRWKLDAGGGRSAE